MRRRAGDERELVVGERARVEQQAAVLDAADHRRVGRAQPGRQLVGPSRPLDAPPPGPGSSSSGSAPPPTRAVAAHDLGRAVAAASRSRALAQRRLVARSSIASTGISRRARSGSR